MVIPGFDSGVLGMTVGEKKTINIPFMEAYGPKQPEMIVEFPKAQFPADLNPTVGMALTMNNGQGQQFQVIVVEVKEEVVVLDANHSLAGQDLTFALELVKIDSPSTIIMP
jgi:peptidylprolyl isomerase